MCVILDIHGQWSIVWEDWIDATSIVKRCGTLTMLMFCVLYNNILHWWWQGCWVEMSKWLTEVAIHLHIQSVVSVPAEYVTSYSCNKINTLPSARYVCISTYTILYTQHLYEAMKQVLVYIVINNCAANKVIWFNEISLLVCMMKLHLNTQN